MKRDLDGPGECLKFQPPYADQEVNSICMPIRQNKHCSNGIIRVSVPALRIETGGNKTLRQIAQPMRRQRHDHIRI